MDDQARLDFFTRYQLADIVYAQRVLEIRDGAAYQ